MTMTKTLMIVAELAVINWALIVAASLIKARAWTPSGMKDALGNREAAVDCHGFPARTERAAKNMLENMVLFTALVLIAAVAGKANAMTAMGALVFFWARLAYAVIYLLGVPWLRTAAWFVSVIGMVMIAWQLF